jgi:hypothetical protein
VIGWIGPLFWPYAYDDFYDGMFGAYALGYGGTYASVGPSAQPRRGLPLFGRAAAFGRRPLLLLRLRLLGLPLLLWRRLPLALLLLRLRLLRLLLRQLPLALLLLLLLLLLLRSMPRAVRYSAI